MKNHLIEIILIVLLFTLLLTPAAGCINVVQQPVQTTAPPASTEKPRIISFTATATTINAGETISLYWQVEGASKVILLPEPGNVASTGSASLAPQSSITYTLMAQNTVGSSSESLSISVQTQSSKPDLVVNRVFLQGAQVYFEVQNIGMKSSQVCHAELYIDGLKEVNGDAVINKLDPGESVTGVFGKYTWNLPFDTQPVTESPDKLVQYEVRVCIDSVSSVDEIDESNNCGVLIMGNKYTYKFYDKLHLAKWFTGAGELILPVPENNAAGSAFTVRSMMLENSVSQHSVLATYPEAVGYGWISGTFADFYTDEYRKSQSRPLKLPKHLRFISTVGFNTNAAPTAAARFIFVLLDQSSTELYRKEIVAGYDSILEQFNEDLSAFAGKSCTMILRVESLDVSGKNYAAWSNPVLTQEW